MNYTAEALDSVIKETGASYEGAKNALIQANGDEKIAIAAIEAEKNGESEALDNIKKKLTDVIKAGNAKKIVVKRNNEEVLSVPLNLGVLGGIIGIAAAPVAVIIGAVAAYGLDCTIEVEKKDGSTETI